MNKHINLSVLFSCFVLPGPCWESNEMQGTQMFPELIKNKPFKEIKITYNLPVTGCRLIKQLNHPLQKTLSREDSCTFTLREFKYQAQDLSGNLLYLKVSGKDCSRSSIEAFAFKCEY